MTEKLKTQSSKKEIMVAFGTSDWEETNKLIQQENKKKGTRIQFRISESEKSVWERFIENNPNYDNISDFMLKLGREKISTQKIRNTLENYNPIEQRFTFLTGIKKINKEIRNSIIKSEKHVEEINKVVMNSDIPEEIIPELLIEKIQKNNIENLYLSAILNKMFTK